MCMCLVRVCVGAYRTRWFSSNYVLLNHISVPFHITDVWWSMPSGAPPFSQQSHYPHGHDLIQEQTHGTEWAEESANDHLENKTSRVLPFAAPVDPLHSAAVLRDSPQKHGGEPWHTASGWKPENAKADELQSLPKSGDEHTQKGAGNEWQSLDFGRSTRSKLPPWSGSARSGRDVATDGGKKQTQQRSTTSSEEMADVSSSTQPGERLI